MCHDDPEALDLLDHAAQEKPGRRWNKQESGLIVYNINNKEEERPRGDRRSEEYQTTVYNVHSDIESRPRGDRRSDEQQIKRDIVTLDTARYGRKHGLMSQLS